MTYSDPLLKELKGYIVIIIGKGSDSLEEQSDLVFSICHCLESIFTKGLIRFDGFSPWKTDPFQWFYQLVRKYHKTIPLEFKIIFDQVLANERTKTPIGKTRLLIRTCLKKRCLHIPVQFHIENQDYDDSSLRLNYNSAKSILGNEILVQILYSLLQQLSFYQFPFEPANCSFLDESWHLPVIVKTEMVPCRQLGLTLGFPMGFAVIVEIIENSCAGEIRNLIGIGDILDDMNGISVRNFYGTKIDDLFKRIRSEPFQLSFIKGRNPKTGQIYLPIIKLYRILALDPLLIGSSEPHEDEDQYLQPPFLPRQNLQTVNQAKSESEGSTCVPSQSHRSRTTSEEDESDDLLAPPKSNHGHGHRPSSSPCQKSPSPCSQLQPYPQSQNNDSSNSALNLQMYNTEADQLIV